MNDEIKNALIFIGVLMLIGFLVVLILYIVAPNAPNIANVTINSEKTNIISKDLGYKQLTFNNVVLTDSTTYNSTSNICTASRYGMSISIANCNAQVPIATDIQHNVKFSWSGTPRNISWIFVYDGQLKSGSMGLLQNVSSVIQQTNVTDAWATNYQVNGVVGSQNLGTPDIRCQIGNEHNTQMYLVNQTSPGNATITRTYYCFTSITPINATSYLISGNYTSISYYNRTIWNMQYNDITPYIKFLGVGLLNDSRSYYQVENVLFNNGTTLDTLWTYTPIANTKKGKWHILGYDTSEGLVNAVANDHYIYVDPWWNSSWTYKQEILAQETSGASLFNFTVNFTVHNNGHFNSDFSDLRFVNATEDGIYPYWIERYNETDAIVYVRLADTNMTANQNTTFFMYYGNAGATNASNKNSTFLFSDDFGGYSLNTNKWFSAIGASSGANLTIDNGYATFIRGSGAGNQVNAALLAKYNLTNPYKITYKMRIASCTASNALWGGAGISATISDYTYANMDSLAGGLEFGCWGSLSPATNQIRITGTITAARPLTAPTGLYWNYTWLGITDTNRTSYINESYNNASTKSVTTHYPILIMWGGGATSPANFSVTDYRIQTWSFKEPTYTFGTEQQNGLAPTITIMNSTPASGATYAVPTVTYIFNATISGSNGTQGVQFDGVNYSLTNWSATQFSKSINDLSAGNHYYYFWAYNSNGFTNSSQVFVLNKAATTSTLTTTPSSPISYPTNSTFSCTNNLIPVNLYVNAVDKGSENGISKLRAAGTYLVNCSAPATQNYSSSEQNTTYLINQNISTVTLLINGTASNLSGTYPGKVNASATANHGTLVLYRDGSDVTSLNSLLEDLSVGTYNFTAYTPGDQNYSSATLTYFAVIGKGSPTLSVSLSPSGTVTFPTETTATATESNSGDGDITYGFFKNDSSVSSPDVQTLPVGNYNYTYNATAGQNWTAKSVSSLLTVTASALHYPQYHALTQNPASGSSYTAPGAAFIFTSNWTVSGSTIGTVLLEFNNTNYSAALNGGLYVVTFTDLIPANYTFRWYANDTAGTTNQTALAVYILNKKTPVGSISVAPSTIFTYPTQTTVTATESNAGDSDVTYKLFLDGVLASNPDYQNLSIGTHTYIFNTTGGQNISQAQIDSKTITVLNTSVSLVNLPYNTTSYTTSTEGFALNVTFDNTVYVNPVVTLNYNSVSYSTTESGSGNTLTFSRSLGVPSVVGEYFFNWTAIMTNTTGGTVTLTSGTSSQNITAASIINITVNPCAPLATAFTFTFADEQNLSNITAKTVAYNIQYGYQGNTTAFVLNGTLTNIGTFNICINNSYPYFSVGSGEIDYQTSNSVERKFYIFQNTRLTNATISNILYSLQNSAATAYQETVEDNQLNLYSGYYTSLLRWYPNLNSYNVVEMSKTDNKGQSVFNVQQNSVDYRIGVYAVDGSLIQLFPAIRFQCTVLPCIYTVFINQNAPDYTSVYGIQSSLTYNATNHRFTYIWNDPSQATTTMNLTAQQISSGNAPITICSNTGSGFTGVLVCDATGYSGTLSAKVTRTASPAKYIESLIISAKTGLTTLANGKTVGLFLLFIFGTFGALVGVFSPIAAIVLGLFALVPAFLLGVIPYMVVVGFFIIGGIVFHFLRRT